MQIKKGLAVVTASIVAVAMFGIAAPAAADTGTTGEVTAALDAVDSRNGNLVVEPVKSATDNDSAAQTATVDIPTDLTQGVKLAGANGKQLTIRVPDARKKNRGKKSRGGVVVYNSSASSVDAAIPTTDGVQLWKHIRNKNAAEDFRYCVDGVNFQVLPSGGAIGIDQANQPVTLVPPPTATEKRTGNSIPTSYKAKDNCLVQHVAHRAKGTNYPVVADPNFWDYAACIFGAGIPIGLAIGIIAFPLALPVIVPFIYRWAQNPVSAGMYVDRVKRHCGRFFG